jgi:hypothetical protein
VEKEKNKKKSENAKEKRYLNGWEKERGSALDGPSAGKPRKYREAGSSMLNKRRHTQKRHRWINNEQEQK